MAKDTSQNLRLGAFVATGTILIVVAFYFIGSKRNLFGSTFQLKANFYNVNGLLAGNTVRFAGIDIGTVEKLEITSDTSVTVIMVVEESVRKYLRKNAIANVGTDGLMGNKLININSSQNPAEAVEDGDVLQSIRPIETNEVMRTLNATNDNIKVITDDLKNITQKLNNSNTLWSLLNDSNMVQSLKQAIVSIRITGDRTAIIAGDLGNIISDVKKGKGSFGALLTDTSLSKKLGQSIVNITLLSDNLAVVSGDLTNISSKVKNGEGTIGTLLMDTTFVQNVNKSMENIKSSSQGLNDNLEALKHSFLLRKYFRKKEKQKDKELQKKKSSK